MLESLEVRDGDREVSVARERSSMKKFGINTGNMEFIAAFMSNPPWNY